MGLLLHLRKSAVLSLVLGASALGNLSSVPVASGLAGTAAAEAQPLEATPTNIDSVLEKARPGDTVVLGDGNWNSVKIVVKRGGAENRPLTLRAAHPGQVILRGSSLLQIDAPYVHFEGIMFTSGGIDKGAVIRLNSHDCVVSNTAIIDYNVPDQDMPCYWVYFAGNNNHVDRCFFKGKTSMHPLIGNELQESRHNTVSNCYFKDIPYRKENGREILRIWGYGKNGESGSDGAFFTVEHCLFDHADGEGQEIISLKSNYNRVVNNTILASRGGIVLRNGNHNTVQGNIVLGQGVKKSYGVRITGGNHLVQDNYIAHCDHGIVLMCGEEFARNISGSYSPKIVPGSDNIKVPVYSQVRELNLTGNVCVSNKGLDLEIGSGYKKNWPEEQLILLPEASTITRNRFVRPEGGDSISGVQPGSTELIKSVPVKANLFKSNTIVGGDNDYPISEIGVTTVKIPSGWNDDKERVGFVPIKPGEVGPEWMKLSPQRAGK